jgi:hypothetical protein
LLERVDPTQVVDLNPESAKSCIPELRVEGLVIVPYTNQRPFRADGQEAENGGPRFV